MVKFSFFFLQIQLIHFHVIVVYFFLYSIHQWYCLIRDLFHHFLFVILQLFQLLLVVNVFLQIVSSIFFIHHWYCEWFFNNPHFLFIILRMYLWTRLKQQLNRSQILGLTHHKHVKLFDFELHLKFKCFEILSFCWNFIFVHF